MRINCQSCGNFFEPTTDIQKFCSDKCRMRNHRAKTKVAKLRVAQDLTDAPNQPSTGQMAGVYASVKETLTNAGVIDSASAQIALALATRLQDPGNDSGSAVSAVAKELRAAMAEALTVRKVSGDLIDELRAKREQRLSS